MYIKIAFLWIRRCKRWGDGADARHTRKIKNCITVGTAGMLEQQRGIAMDKLKIFLCENILKEKMKWKVVEFFRLVIFM